MGLDLIDLTQNELPSLCADAHSGRAEWLSGGGCSGSGSGQGGDVEVYVLGAEQDYLVDEEGVAETARFFGQVSSNSELHHEIKKERRKARREKVEQNRATIYA